MRKIVFAFLILFIFSFSVFAGEINGNKSQAVKRIVVASGDETCKRECAVNRNTCMSDCSRSDTSYKSRNNRDSYERSTCKENCMRSYDNCLDRCR